MSIKNSKKKFSFQRLHNHMKNREKPLFEIQEKNEKLRQSCPLKSVTNKRENPSILYIT